MKTPANDLVVVLVGFVVIAAGAVVATVDIRRTGSRASHSQTRQSGRTDSHIVFHYNTSFLEI
jgi:hypothetical protein